MEAAPRVCGGAKMECWERGRDLRAAEEALYRWRLSQNGRKSNN
jgi:hypothetical protein